MRKIIITDLTRFKNPENLCTAGIDSSNGETIRPIPYFRKKFCDQLAIMPGTILKGNFTKRKEPGLPHIEDNSYSGITKAGTCSAADFQQLLKDSSYANVSEGFAVEIEERQKHIPHDLVPKRSLLTITGKSKNDSYNGEQV